MYRRNAARFWGLVITAALAVFAMPGGRAALAQPATASSADIDDNGTKLQTAHDRYQHTEESLTTLAQQISDPAQIH